MAPGHERQKLKNAAEIDLNDTRYYINRQLSWLKFNRRVLQEALEARHPLLERVKFLAIFSSNLDEFFMIRISGLRRQIAAGVMESSQDGLSPIDQMLEIRRELTDILAQQSACWHNDLLPQLHAAGINILHYHELRKRQRERMREYFMREIFPVLTPLAFDPSHPFPHISNLSLNLAVVVKDPRHGELFARIKVPDTFPRLLPLPHETPCEDEAFRALTGTQSNEFVWLEDVIAANLDALFPGLEIGDSFTFRVTRDADLTIEEDEADDLLEMIEEGVEMREFGSEIRLEIDKAAPEHIRALLIKNLQIAPYLVYAADTPLGMSDLMELTRLDRRDLKDQAYVPMLPASLPADDNIFTAITRQDRLLYHPYHSFSPVIDFIREAARDPNVLAIKQTLYRVGQKPPIIDALMEARENGKQVAVLVELKARFDEQNNIAWARALEQAGVHVVYGLLGLKTHAKMCLIVRRERDGIVRYVHLGTGNYNTVTSRLYTDFSFFTCNPAIGEDVSDLFNALTGYSHKEVYQKLLVAPGTMRTHLIARIEREITRHREHGDGLLLFKMNSLVDPECIRALYRASQAGVRVDLQIRGICCLRPGIPGVSENITVTSIIGRYLEHSRIYCFHYGGEDEVLLGSADLMPRNLDRRVEVLFPVENRALRELIVQRILQTHLRDNVQSWQLCPDGHYERIHPASGHEAMNSQLWLMAHARHIG